MSLRERVARAIAVGTGYTLPGEVWESYLPEADAVLAELAPELAPRQPQLQSVLDAAIERALIDGTVAVKVIPSAELGLTKAEPVAFTVPRDIRLGETIYTPPGEEVRFCYTRGQPDNVNAWRLGEACRRASENPGGDYIDGGLSLLKELEARGYGVFRFVKDTAPQASAQANAEDVALVDEVMRGWPKFREAWQRIRASLEVGK
jgi:hypothetical protein